MKCVVCRKLTAHRIIVYGKHSGEPLIVPACEIDCAAEAQEQRPPQRDWIVS